MPTIEAESNHTFLQIIKDIRNDLSTLFRLEINLAKSEIKDKAITYAKNAAFIGVSLVVSIYSILFLLLALSNLLGLGLVAAGLTASMAGWIAPLVLGLILGGTALFLVLKAIKSISKVNLIPKKTLESLHENQAWLSDKVKG